MKTKKKSHKRSSSSARNHVKRSKTTKKGIRVLFSNKGSIITGAVIVAAVLFVSVLVIRLDNTASALSRPNRALIYGDSLTWESQKDITKGFAGNKTWFHKVIATPNTGPCNWLQTLPSNIKKFQPNVIVLTTVGDSGSTCMRGLTQGTAAYYNKYQSDLNTFFAESTAAGAKVVFIEGPPMLNATWNSAVSQIEQIAANLATKYTGVSISTGPRLAVSNNGVYTSYLPCLSSETAADGCVNGQIAVRTITGIQTGVHFCPVGLTPRKCATYSSGEVRFGEAIAKTVLAV